MVILEWTIVNLLRNKNRIMRRRRKSGMRPCPTVKAILGERGGRHTRSRRLYPNWRMESMWKTKKNNIEAYKNHDKWQVDQELDIIIISSLTQYCPSPSPYSVARVITIILRSLQYIRPHLLSMIKENRFFATHSSKLYLLFTRWVSRNVHYCAMVAGPILIGYGPCRASTALKFAAMSAINR